LERIEDEFPQLQVYGDRTGEVRNAIEEVVSDWPRPGSTDLTTIKTAIERSSKHLDKAILGCFQMTIPADVQWRLSKFPVGKAFNFEHAYEDKVPGKSTRERILGELEQREVWGWVDLKEGLIYKISPERRIRILTYLAPLFSVLAAVLALVLVPAGLERLGVDLSGLHLDDTEATVAAFLLVLSGAVIHLVVENVKQFQMDSAPIVAIGNLLDWMHLRWAGISLMVLPILVIAVGMRTLVESTPDQVATYVLAGYSADSVAGLFLTRFNSSAGASVKGLIKRLKKDEAPQGK
ncbi:MAG TPA: hypothetical protein VGV69_01035, partial [Solirubrobacterales bacterium]|nr:hypothetical protein [Solirubrobacterales bacterium]